MKKMKAASGKKPASEKSDKTQKFENVAQAIFRILLVGGPQNVNHSAVSRSSGVSRAWLYKYVAKSSDELIRFSLGALTTSFAKLEGLEKQNSAAEVRKSLFRGTFRMIADATEQPAFLSLYYRYFGAANGIGKTIRELESRYIQLVQTRIERNFSRSAKDARAVSEIMQGIRMGLAHRLATLSTQGYAVEHADLRLALRRVLQGFLDEMDEEDRLAK